MHKVGEGVVHLAAPEGAASFAKSTTMPVLHHSKAGKMNFKMTLHAATEVG